MKNKDIGQQLASLNHLIKRNLQNELSSELMRISAANGYILVYLYENKQNDVFQRDLEAEFQIARSTASGILQAMEKKKLIIRQSIPRDARLKRLVLTEKGTEFQLEIMENFDRVQEALRGEIPADKLKCFLEVVDLLKENAVKDYREKWGSPDSCDENEN